MFVFCCLCCACQYFGSLHQELHRYLIRRGVVGASTKDKVELKRLEREYLVTIMPRRGIMVTEVDLRTQLQLMEIRRGPGELNWKSE